MSRAVLASLGVLAAAVLAVAQPAALTPETPAPDFALTDLTGKYVKLSRGYGRQVTVVALGRLGAGSCREALRELQQLHQRYRGDRVGVYAISLDDPQARGKAVAVAKQLGLTYPVLVDTDLTLPAAYQVREVPRLLVVDASGVIRFSEAGPQPGQVARLATVVDRYRPPKLPRVLNMDGLGCAACRTMPPLLRQLEQEFAGRIRMELRDFDLDLADEYGLETLPAQIFYDAEGREVYRHGGLMTRAEVLEQFRKMGVATE